MNNEFHFISSNVTDEDKDLFFGPLTGEEEFIVIEDGWSMHHILHVSGVFPSITIARKNEKGKSSLIPDGFTEINRGKNRNRKRIFILNIK